MSKAVYRAKWLFLQTLTFWPIFLIVSYVRDAMNGLQPSIAHGWLALAGVVLLPAFAVVRQRSLAELGEYKDAE